MMELEMTSSEELLQSLKVSLLTCDPTGRVEEVLSQEPNVHPDLQTGWFLFDCIGQSSLQDFTARWNAMTELHAEFDMPLQMLLPESERWYRVRVSLLRDNRRRVVLMVPADREVRAEQEKSAHWKAILETAVDAIITIDERGCILTANRAVEEMFHYSSDELVGRNISVLMSDAEAGEHDRYLQRYLQTGEAAIIGVGRKVNARRKDGSLCPIHLAVSEFTVHGRRRFTGILRDLTELESVQRQLLQSERLAAIGQMVTGLAHESRNALQRAQAHLDMLSLDLSDRPEQLDLAVRSKTALQDLHRLYEEVKNYAAPIQLEYRDVDLASIWRKEWSHLEAERAGRQIAVSEVVDCTDTSCHVDVHRIEQVFRNIMENAIHACGDSGTLCITCSEELLNKRPAISVSLTDDGAGLSGDAAEHLFEPFFTTKQKGTGLGLAIVERIVQAHQGTVTAVPGRTRGTVVQIVLPRNPERRNNVRRG
ncbi:MAG: PAS domain S-box protein [Planctomycetaceae bacterium]|nr:PAS domain S-box protein [Planctomycetaceae bacterium]